MSTVPNDLLPAALDCSPFYSEEHSAFRNVVRRWVDDKIVPFADQWESAGEFPRDLYRQAAEIGLLQLGYPEEYGGIEADIFFQIIAFQEVARAGLGGVSAGLFSHTIGAPIIVKAGSESVKARVLPEILSGEKISALAVTEPSGGSDVARLRTTARRDGNHYVVNGSKIFITSGVRADYITTAVRTGEGGRGGISILLIEGDMPGISRTPMEKMGWWCSDTAIIHFDDVRVPVENLLGGENEGFRLAAHNFNTERITMAANCVAFAQVCLDEAVDYARQRQTFGKPLLGHQVVRHKLVDMAMNIKATQAMLEILAWRVMQGENPIAEISMLKNKSTLTMEQCAREAVQILGGAGYMRGSKSERIYREVRVNAIGGGAEEIMRDLAARQMGW